MKFTVFAIALAAIASGFAGSASAEAPKKPFNYFAEQVRTGS